MKKALWIASLLILISLAAGAGAEDYCIHVWKVSFDAEYHWGTCVACGDTYGPEFHYVSCDSGDPGTCSDCGAKAADGAVIGHVMHYFDEDALEHDPYSHYYVCQKCGQHIYSEYHWASCQSPNACQICGAKTADGAVMDDFIHDWSMECDNTHHWEVCTLCGEETDPELHFADCTAADKGVCSACGASAANGAEIVNIAHYYDDEDGLCYNDADHWYVCAKCGEEIMKGPHFNLCGMPGICAFCGIPFEGSVVHIPESLNDYAPYDAKFHRFECGICHEEVLETHEFENGECIYCGAKNTFVPAKYTLQDPVYDGRAITGRLIQTEGTAPAKDLSVRVTFFITGNYYMATVGEVDADGAFLVEGVGPIEYISLLASGTETNPFTGETEQKTFATAECSIP